MTSLIFFKYNVWFLFSHISKSNWLWSIESKSSNNMDRCNYLIHHTSWIVEKPINGRQYHQTIASLCIQHLVDNHPLSQVMISHIASAQGSNPQKIATEQGIIIFSLLSRLIDTMTLADPFTNAYYTDTDTDTHTYTQWSSANVSTMPTLTHLIIFFDSTSLCRFRLVSSRFIIWWFGIQRQSATTICCRWWRTLSSQYWIWRG